MDLNISLANVVTIGYYIIAISTVIYVILDNRPPLKTLSWILVLLFLPLIGMILYFYFGHNFRKEKLFEGKKKLDYKEFSRLVSEQSININLHKGRLHPDIQSKLKVINLLLANGKSRVSRKNRATVLQDGKETYESILTALRKAEKHIHIEYYIFEEGEIADQIKDILVKKAAKEHVVVRFIYDSVGSWNLSNGYVRELQKAGVRTEAALPVRFPTLTSKVNYRNHRKIIVVDGKVGFLGGINISDKYIKGDPELKVPWRDTHLRLEGDAVNDLQLIFLTDWYFLTDEEIAEESVYFPGSEIEEECIVQVLASGPDTDFQGVMKAYFSAITTARDSLTIVSPYFIPNEAVLTGLKTTAASGVKVRMMLPGVSDSKLVQFASQSYFEELLESGVKIYLYYGGFIHAKVLMVDGIYSTIGTANMDFRSFEQNLEVNAIIYDRGIHHELITQFEKDLERCKEVTLEEWRQRHRGRKITESFSRLFAPIM